MRDSSAAPADIQRPAVDEATAFAARAVLDIDLGAIAHNLALVRALCPGAKIMPILKGDAYGMGAAPIALALQRQGVAGFGVDNVGEGVALRNSGVRLPILVLDGCVAENAGIGIQYELTPGIASEQLLWAYEEAAHKSRRQVSVWLYFNCGFNRSGYRASDEFSRFVQAAAKCRWLSVSTLYSHLTAAHSDAAYTARQIDEYESALSIARAVLGAPVASSLLASHGILRVAGTFATDWVRPGIMLYGADCFESHALTRTIGNRLAQLVPAVCMRARLLHKRTFQHDEFYGYGCARQARAGQCLGTVAAGFGNGLPLGPENASYTLGTRHYRVVCVGMDYSQIELPAGSAPEIGDWLTLFGDSRLGCRSLKDFAASVQLSPYVLMRRIQAARRYRESGASHAI